MATRATVLDGFRITQYFDTINSKYGPHHAVDYAAPKGTPVYAVADGTIKRADSTDPLGGNRIDYDIGNGMEVGYAHLDSMLVSAGQAVHKGQLLGFSGASGSAVQGGAHLHVSLKKDGQTVDPMGLFDPFTGSSGFFGTAVTFGKDVLDKLPDYAKPLKGTSQYSGGLKQYVGLPMDVEVPNGQNCPAGYHEGAFPTFGNASGTKICSLPGNPLAEAAATTGDVASSIPEFLGTLGEFIFNGANWLRLGALIGGSFIAMQGFRMVLGTTGTTIPSPIPQAVVDAAIPDL